MATFPSIAPSYQARKTTTPRVNTAQFLDGYQHRIKFGLNTRPFVWSLTFNVSQTDSDTIETFLEARADDGASFDFTLPSESSSRKFVCTSFPRSIPFLNRVTLSCTFREVFEA